MPLQNTIARDDASSSLSARQLLRDYLAKLNAESPAPPPPIILDRRYDRDTGPHYLPNGRLLKPAKRQRPDDHEPVTKADLRRLARKLRSDQARSDRETA